MTEFKRVFTHQLATRTDTPLMVGITGFSSSGKTYSALELAVGIQSVRGGRIFVLDTEGGRALHYAPLPGEKADRAKGTFDFEHVPFSKPFSALDYLAALEHCVKAGAKILIVDSMSHEHDGYGGLLDQMEEYLQRKAGDNWDKRDQYTYAAQIKPKAERKRLNQQIMQWTDIAFIFCYRAHEKLRIPKKGTKDPDGRAKAPDKGWAPISTSPLFYDLTLRLLLPPGSDGRPLFFPQDEGEKLVTKLPCQFREWFKAGDQLNAEIGRKLALWAKGGGAAPAPAPTPQPAAPPPSAQPAQRATPSYPSTGASTGTVKNVLDEPKAAGKAQWYVIKASDGADYYTKDATIADRARNACEVEAEMEFTYTMKAGASGLARVLDSFTIKKEE